MQWQIFAKSGVGCESEKIADICQKRRKWVRDNWQSIPGWSDDSSFILYFVLFDKLSQQIIFHKTDHFCNYSVKCIIWATFEYHIYLVLLDSGSFVVDFLPSLFRQLPTKCAFKKLYYKKTSSLWCDGLLVTIYIPFGKFLLCKQGGAILVLNYFVSICWVGMLMKAALLQTEFVAGGHIKRRNFSHSISIIWWRSGGQNILFRIPFILDIDIFILKV